jgi:hypothetical protein
MGMQQSSSVSSLTVALEHSKPGSISEFTNFCQAALEFELVEILSYSTPSYSEFRILVLLGECESPQVTPYHLWGSWSRNSVRAVILARPLRLSSGDRSSDLAPPTRRSPMVTIRSASSLAAPNVRGPGTPLGHRHC